MEESSLLQTTAEVSVAFTGFIGIFLVLATQDGRFPPGESWTIRLIVVCSVAPVFYGVLPLLLESLGFSGALLWRISSITIGVAGIGIAVYMAPMMRALPPGEGRSLNYGFFLSIVASLCCVANAVGWPLAPSGGVYLLSLWSIVGVAAGNFVGLIFRKVL